MIWLTRVNGTKLMINVSLIKYVEAVPDTVVTLVDGSKIRVKEAPEEIAEMITTWYAKVFMSKGMLWKDCEREKFEKEGLLVEEIE